MTLQQLLNISITAAMKSKDELKLRVLRGLKNAITNNVLTKGNVKDELSDQDVLGLIRKEIAKRQDSIEQFTKGNRSDLVANETAEMELLKQFLPQELSSDELDALVQSAITELGATSKRDMGKVIKRVVELANGRADNKVISQKVGSLLQ